MTDEFNPTDHKAAEVKEKLETASPQEKEAIVAAERNSGSPRKSVLEAAGVDPNVRTDAAGRELLAHEVDPANMAGGHPNLGEEREE